MKKKLIDFEPNELNFKFGRIYHPEKDRELAELETKFMQFCGFKQLALTNNWVLSNKPSFKFMTTNEFKLIHDRISNYIKNLKFYSCNFCNINRKYCKKSKSKIPINLCNSCTDYELDSEFDNLEVQQRLVLTE